MKLNKSLNRRSKHMLLALLCMMLVYVINIGSTLAYYSAKSGDITNIFTFSEDIRADLIEPNWNQNEGIKLVPGKQVAKDPMITNTCQIPEYAAVKLTFQYNDRTTTMSAEDYARLMNLLVIEWNTGTGDTQWTAVLGNGTCVQTYVYNKQITAGEISAPVFNSIRVKTKAEGLTEAELRWLQGIKIVNGEIVPDTAGLSGLNIKVEGAVVQADTLDNSADAYATLISLFS